MQLRPLIDGFYIGIFLVVLAIKYVGVISYVVPKITLHDHLNFIANFVERGRLARADF